MNSSAFTLENRTNRWGIKLWSLTFDLPGEKVNKLGEAVLTDMESLLGRLEEMGKSGEIEVLMLRSGKPKVFIAGADIKLIQNCKTPDDGEALCHRGHRLLNRWEDLPFPTVAAVNGAALGGGCELCLASTAIVMSNDPSAKIGLPETQLGVIPGLGGCVRLPRKVGLATALDMILTAKQLDGDRAFKGGLAEACLQKENFEESAEAWAKANLKRLKSGERIAREPKFGGMGGAMGKVLESPVGRGIVFGKAKDGVMSKTRGQYPAPLAAIDVLRKTFSGFGPKLKGSARDAALGVEAKAFGKLASTEVSKNLIGLFYMMEEVKKSSGLPAGSTAKAHPVRTGGVLGAGVMGGGIAQLFADKGIQARMKDITSQALETGMKAVTKLFEKKVKKRRMSRRDMLQKINLVAPTLDYAGFRSVDLVVEAVVEKMDVKKAVLKDLEKQVHDDCVIATNTSSLSVSEMQTALARPERFAGMHFFNPVHLMPLVEVIRGAKSSDEAVSTVFELAKRLGKQPIVVKDAPGFLVNRLLLPYMNEATYLLLEGVTVEEIDGAILEFGMPMGPLELIDEVGVDVGEKVLHILHEAFGERMVPAPIAAKVAGSGRLGKKNGKGVYKYEGSPGTKMTKQLDPEIYGLLGVTPKKGSVGKPEIVERCVYAMINEASRCLDEKVVGTAWEVDLAMIMGTGFPPFRGGLLKYADAVGSKNVVDALKRYESRFGARFAPAPSLVRLAERNGKFY
ncbi:MAG TPA: 3-hydroxyacyl-CoA dehydrogenase NAD-binding domain-containing protein [Bdellovibrionota bacterium]|nr:3-hydroxyacyl-CoA dehydrogenase NAD-binding domain-containing protein [Bdellovibrionota bacterium]